MVYLLALLIFAVLSASSWFLAVAAYRSTVSGYDPGDSPHYRRVAAAAVGFVTLSCFVPFRAGFPLNLLIWAAAIFGFLAIPAPRKLLLFCYLAAASILERLVIMGVLDLTK